MTITPFLTLKLRSRKSALHARQTARRIAQLLCFSPFEQTCIAAGTFAVACQALVVLGKREARICFQIEGRQLQVYVETPASEPQGPSPAQNRISELLRDNDPKTLYRLAKPLPPAQNVAELDLAWLVGKLEETAPGGAFEEVIRQNQEMLALLHELRLCQARPAEKEEKTSNHHAA